MVPIRTRACTSLGYLAVYVVAVVAGLSSVSAVSGLAYYWPAAGVGALWMLHSRTRGQLVVDATLLLASTTVVDGLLDIPWPAAALFGLAHLTIAGTVRVASALIEGLPIAGPLPRRVSGKRDLAGLGVASLVASVVSAPIGVAAAYASTGNIGWETTAAWVVRNSSGTFVVVASVLAILTAVFRAHARRGWATRLTSNPRPYWLPELALAALISLGATVLVFASMHQAPIAFLLIVPATWIGYRFSPVVTGFFAIVLSTLAVLWTQAGRGPFAPIEDLTARALTVQAYVLVVSILLLVLSLGVSERETLLSRVVDSEARATSRAELLDAIMNAITDGLVVFEPSGQPMMHNPAADLLGGNTRRPGELGAPEDHGLFHLDGSPMEEHELPHARALAGELVTSEDLLRIDPDTGQQAILSLSAVPLHRAQTPGGPLAVLVVHDVTKERSHRRELEAFTGTVAHDLKVPLTGVGSWAEILGDQLDDLDLDVDVDVDVSEAMSSLRHIQSSAVRMKQLIDDLLGYSRAQNTTLRPISVSLTTLVEEVALDVAEASTDTPPIIEFDQLGQVLVDRVLVRQLVANVVGNAVKYVAPGTRPHVRISSGSVGDMLEVRVTDNGIGIPRAERGRIFDSFYRASSSGSYPGTGLGLSICARAVERHGGRISAREGTDGVGTTMVFTLPLAPEPTRVDTPAVASTEEPPRTPVAERPREQLSAGS